jgi:LacI family transcriptional regulator
MSKRGPNRATIVDIAERVGVSAMTVSRALTGSPEVSAKTRARVLRCAEAIGYRPNRWARSLVTRRSSIVGIVVPDIGHSYFAEITHGVEEILDRAGFDLVLCHSNLDAKKESSEIDALISSQVDGLIVASEQPEKSPGPFEDLERRKIPFVLIDRFFGNRNFPSVRVDDDAVGRIATECLLNLGHRRIGHIAGPSISPSHLRLRGYREALEARGVGWHKEWVVSGHFEIESGREAMKKLLAAPRRPTAVFAANDPMAIGAVYACRDAGLAVPRDVSVIGAGNIEGEYHPNPFLTTVDWPRHELGRAAARMLLSLIEHASTPPPELLEPRVLVRQSTAQWNGH